MGRSHISISRSEVKDVQKSKEDSITGNGRGRPLILALEDEPIPEVCLGFMLTPWYSCPISHFKC